MISGILNLFFKTEIEEEPNIGENLRRVVQSKNFENKINAVTPFFIGSILAWPAYWIYQGYSWRSKRGIESLQVYIRKTYFQAKFLQLLIISAGLILTVGSDTRRIVLNAKNDI